MSITKLLLTLSFSMSGPLKALFASSALLFSPCINGDCETLVTLRNLEQAYPPAASLQFLSPNATVLTKTLIECMNYVLDPIDSDQFCGDPADNYTHLSVPFDAYNQLIFDLSIYNASCVNFLSQIVHINNNTFQPKRGSYICVSLLKSSTQLTTTISSTTSTTPMITTSPDNKPGINIENTINIAAATNVKIINSITIDNNSNRRLQASDVGHPNNRRLAEATTTPIYLLPPYCTDVGVGLQER